MRAKVKTLPAHPDKLIQSKIISLRGQKVILDKELAQLYGVTTKRLNEQVKRNMQRFPADFMFKLDFKEFSSLRSQIATSNLRGGQRYMPMAFTANGVAMLSSVLNSERAIQINIQIMRIFTKVRHLSGSSINIQNKISKLEERVDEHEVGIKASFDGINFLLGREKKRIEAKN
jgi:hypothetical protein